MDDWTPAQARAVLRDPRALRAFIAALAQDPRRWLFVKAECRHDYATLSEAVWTLAEVVALRSDIDWLAMEVGQREHADDYLVIRIA